MRTSANFREFPCARYLPLSSSCQRDSISRESRFTLSFKSTQIVRLTSRKCTENISKFPTLSRALTYIINRLKYTTRIYFCRFYDNRTRLRFSPYEFTQIAEPIRQETLLFVPVNIEEGAGGGFARSDKRISIIEVENAR